ncbi:MAG: hypothetical protein K6A41_07440 [Bacteroidales bacterium]|nr:hypothetical protein [Bacteroidales bacterium]
MRKILPIVIAALVLFTACQKKKDKLAAEVYYHKLYESEIRNNMPSGLSKEDSMTMVHEYINQWVREQLLLHEADRLLSAREKNFDKKIDEYRNSLLINALYDKLAEEMTVDEAALKKEMADFNKRYDNSYAVKRPIMQLNYVKLPKGSPILPEVRAILFDPSRRTSEKDTLVALLGDSIEYMLDDDQWLYVEDIQREVSVDIEPEMVKTHPTIEKEIGNDHYLLVILKYKSQRSVSETEEEQAAVRMMLVNQRRQQYLDEYVNKLYDEALKKGVIIQ